MQMLFLLLGGSRWWLVGSVHVFFLRPLGKAYTKYCPLSLPKRAECLCVCFHCLSGVVFITLNHSCRIRTYSPDAGDHGELFWSGFWLRWFSLLCTHWGQVYWHNASLVLNMIQILYYNAWTAMLKTRQTVVDYSFKVVLVAGSEIETKNFTSLVLA